METIANILSAISDGLKLVGTEISKIGFLVATAIGSLGAFFVLGMSLLNKMIDFLHKLDQGADPLTAVFPTGYSSSLAFANYMFPVQESFTLMIFLGASMAVASTIRTIKAWIPSIG